MASSAPRFQWKCDPAGRVALVLSLYITDHLGYHDQDILYEGRFPTKVEIEGLFINTMPWFANYYNDNRNRRAEVIGFNGRMDPFGINDLMDRLGYMFYKKSVSDEHPMSLMQAKSGKLREVWLRLRPKVAERVITCRQISQEEAIAWGQKVQK